MSQAQQREEAAAEEAARQPILSTPTPPPQPISPVELQTTTTETDEFGRYRIYQKRPDHEPRNIPQPDHNAFATEAHQGDTEDLASRLRMPSLSELPGLVGLFINSTIALLVQWFYSGSSTKSLADVQHLIDDVILHEDFKAEDLQGVNFATEVKKLDTFESSLEGKGWKESSVKIKVPCPGFEEGEGEAKEFEVKGVLHRDLVDIIKIACQDPDTLDSFHTTPFKEMWKPSEDAEPIRLYGEAYTSDKMINAYEEVQNLPLIQRTQRLKMLLQRSWFTQMLPGLHNLGQPLPTPSTSSLEISQNTSGVNQAPMQPTMVPTSLRQVQSAPQIICFSLSIACVAP